MSIYDTLRHLADSYGLVVTFGLYLALCGWHFLPRASAHAKEAKHSIFKDQDDGE